MLREHIAKVRARVDPTGVWGVNVPVFYKHAPQAIEVVIQERVPIVFTSGGSPKLYTRQLKDEGHGGACDADRGVSTKMRGRWL